MFTKPKNKLVFEKYHGLGNDFIFVPHIQLKKFKTIDEIKSFAVKICNRHYAVGADGVVFFRVLKKSKRAEILIVNSDGSFAATCGNALRCLGLKLFGDKTWNGKKALPIFRLSVAKKDRIGLQPDELFSLETKKPFATILKIENTKSKQNPTLSAIVSVLFDGPKIIYRWNGGNILVSSPDISVSSGDISSRDTSLSSRGLTAGSSVPFSKIASGMDAIFVQLENPHLVCFSPEFQNFSNEESIAFGNALQKCINVNIGMLAANSISPSNVLQDEKNSFVKNSDVFALKVFERGAGLTLACGSGAVAGALALRFAGHIPNDVNSIQLQMPGGIIKVTLPETSHEKIILSAEAAFVCFILGAVDNCQQLLISAVQGKNIRENRSPLLLPQE